MSTPQLRDIWEASASQPFQPTVGKNSQFQIGFSLILFAFILTGLFGLSMLYNYYDMYQHTLTTCSDNTLKNVPLYGIPASLAFG